MLIKNGIKAYWMSIEIRRFKFSFYLKYGFKLEEVKNRLSI